MNEIIGSLNDNDAIRILITIANAHIDFKREDTDLAPELRNALQDEFGVDLNSGSISDGDMARQALEFLSSDNRMRDEIVMMAKGSTPEKLMEPVVGLTLAAAVVFVLKTNVELSRSENGKWSFSIKSEALENSLLKGFVQRLLSWVPQGPFEK